MNENNAHLYLPFVQALADGKIIQAYDGHSWTKLDRPSFTRPPCAYRIKPEPRKWTVWIDHDGYIQATGHLSRTPIGWTQIEVTETLPENEQ